MCPDSEIKHKKGFQIFVKDDVCFRYFHYYENMIEWCVLVLVLLSLLPDIWFISDPYIQKHLAAFTFLLAFMQV